LRLIDPHARRALYLFRYYFYFFFFHTISRRYKHNDDGAVVITHIRIHNSADSIYLFFICLYPHRVNNNTTICSYTAVNIILFDYSPFKLHSTHIRVSESHNIKNRFIQWFTLNSTNQSPLAAVNHVWVIIILHTIAYLLLDSFIIKSCLATRRHIQRCRWSF